MLRVCVALVVLLALGLAACSKSESPRAHQTAASPSTRTAPPLGPSAATLAGDPAPTEPLLAVRAWNRALNARDQAQLEKLYAERVSYYGVDLGRAAVIGKKRAALERAPRFQQSLSKLEVHELSRADVAVTFTKTWTSDGTDKQTVEALLDLERRQGKYVITRESDTRAEARRRGGLSACDDAVLQAVAATAPAKELLGGPVARDRGHSSNGMHIGARPPESTVFSVAIHETHETHLATLAWFEVEPKTGVVRQSVPSRRMLAAPPKLAGRVRLYCGE